MARNPVLGDEEILRRARAVFVEWGHGARTKQIAAAVGLTWGAIALRFGSKGQLFREAMAGPLLDPAGIACEAAAGADLPNLIEQLRCQVWERWPQRLHYRLATRAPDPEGAPERQLDWLAATLAAHARCGAVRCDVPTKALAQLVLALLVGDVAQRFINREPAADRAFVDGVLRLLAGPPTPTRPILDPEPSWTGCNR